jgi:hypothetical protein
LIFVIQLNGRYVFTYIHQYKWNMNLTFILQSQQVWCEEAEELASNVLAASLLVVHDTSGGGQDNVTELTGGNISTNGT